MNQIKAHTTSPSNNNYDRHPGDKAQAYKNEGAPA